jgi:membrane-associated protease RseP (regulator of RpoE activity)
MTRLVRSGSLVVLGSAIIATLQASTAVAGELRGAVRSISGEVVTIRCEGGVSPNPGDPVKIGFEVPDVGFVALEGSWKVTLIGPGGEIQASPISGAHGEPQIGHVVLITTSAAVPRAPSRQPPPQRGAHPVPVAGPDRSGLPPFAQKPWMGIRFSGDEGDVRSGVPIEGVTPGGPADRAGIKAGDVIASINGAPIPNTTALDAAIDSIRPGDVLVVRLMRLPDMIEMTIAPQLPSLDDPVVQTSIGVAFLAGRGVEPDERQAVEWLERAAGQGFQDAKDILATYRDRVAGGGKPVGPQPSAVYIAGNEEGKRPAWFILETGIFNTVSAQGAPVRDLPPDIWSRRNSMSSTDEVFRSLEPLGGGWLLWVEVSIHWGHIGFAKDRVHVQCFDPSGRLQWEEDASNVMANSADHSIQILAHKINKKLQKKRGKACLRP